MGDFVLKIMGILKDRIRKPTLLEVMVFLYQIPFYKRVFQTYLKPSMLCMFLMIATSESREKSKFYCTLFYFMFRGGWEGVGLWWSELWGDLGCGWAEGGRGAATPTEKTRPIRSLAPPRQKAPC